MKKIYLILLVLIIGNFLWAGDKNDVLAPYDYGQIETQNGDGGTMSGDAIEDSLNNAIRTMIQDWIFKANVTLGDTAGDVIFLPQGTKIILEERGGYGTFDDSLRIHVSEIYSYFDADNIIYLITPTKIYLAGTQGIFCYGNLDSGTESYFITWAGNHGGIDWNEDAAINIFWKIGKDTLIVRDSTTHMLEWTGPGGMKMNGLTFSGGKLTCPEEVPYIWNLLTRQQGGQEMSGLSYYRSTAVDDDLFGQFTLPNLIAGGNVVLDSLLLNVRTIGTEDSVKCYFRKNRQGTPLLVDSTDWLGGGTTGWMSVNLIPNGDYTIETDYGYSYSVDCVNDEVNDIRLDIHIRAIFHLD